MLESIALKLFYWALEKLGAFGVTLVKKYVKYGKIDKKVDTQTSQVGSALIEIKEFQEKSKNVGRLPRDLEKKLRDSTARLSDNIFN